MARLKVWNANTASWEYAAGNPTLTAAEILSALLTVDGTGSGLDADLLDGINSTGFATAAQGATADTAVQPATLAAYKLDDLAAPDDNTDLNASTTRHGLLRKLSNTSTEFLNGQGNWAAPTATPLTIGHPVASGGTRIGLPGVNWTTVPGQGLTTDRMYYAPFLVETAITVDAMLSEVTSAAGTVLRLGIYNADTAWQPTSLVQDAGTVNPSTTGLKTASFTAIVLPAGRYLTALACNGAATLRVVKGSIRTGDLFATLTSSPFQTAFTKNSVGTGALASTGVAWDTIVENTTPFIFMTFLRITAV